MPWTLPIGPVRALSGELYGALFYVKSGLWEFYKRRKRPAKLAGRLPVERHTIEG